MIKLILGFALFVWFLSWEPNDDGIPSGNGILMINICASCCVLYLMPILLLPLSLLLLSLYFRKPRRDTESHVF